MTPSLRMVFTEVTKQIIAWWQNINFKFDSPLKKTVQ